MAAVAVHLLFGSEARGTLYAACGSELHRTLYDNSISNAVREQDFARLLAPEKRWVGPCKRCERSYVAVQRKRGKAA